MVELFTEQKYPHNCGSIYLRESFLINIFQHNFDLDLENILASPSRRTNQQTTTKKFCESHKKKFIAIFKIKFK